MRTLKYQPKKKVLVLGGKEVYQLSNHQDLKQGDIYIILQGHYFIFKLLTD